MRHNLHALEILLSTNTIPKIALVARKNPHIDLSVFPTFTQLLCTNPGVLVLKRTARVSSFEWGVTRSNSCFLRGDRAVFVIFGQASDPLFSHILLHCRRSTLPITPNLCSFDSSHRGLNFEPKNAENGAHLAEIQGQTWSILHTRFWAGVEEPGAQTRGPGWRPDSDFSQFLPIFTHNVQTFF